MSDRGTLTLVIHPDARVRIRTPDGTIREVELLVGLWPRRDGGSRLELPPVGSVLHIDPADIVDLDASMAGALRAGFSHLMAGLGRYLGTRVDIEADDLIAGLDRPPLGCAIRLAPGPAGEGVH